jgi:hypothetical protein
MYRDHVDVAIEAGLHFESELPWCAPGEHPHVAPFRYRAFALTEDDSEHTLARVSGFRLSHDWTVADDLVLWDEADALDSSAVRYVEALIRELRAVATIGDADPPGLEHVQRITIVGHIEPAGDPGAECSPDTWRACVASLLTMDAPRLVLVDPRVMPERRDAGGKLLSRGRVRELLTLGLQRMVASPFLWAWDVELALSSMASYDYHRLVETRREGRLDDILRSSLWRELHGSARPELATLLDYPVPEDFDE